MAFVAAMQISESEQFSVGSKGNKCCHLKHEAYTKLAEAGNTLGEQQALLGDDKGVQDLPRHILAVIHHQAAKACRHP